MYDYVNVNICTVVWFVVNFIVTLTQAKTKKLCTKLNLPAGFKNMKNYADCTSKGNVNIYVLITK